MSDGFKDRDDLEGLERVAIDVDRLGVDWARQRAMINRGIEARRARGHVLRTAFAGALATVVVAAIALVIWWKVPSAPDAQELDQFFTEMDSISEDYVPAGLYVLNGYIDMQPDAEAMLEYVAPQEGGEEGL